MKNNYCNKPAAQAPLKSYRCKNRYGFTMIGAMTAEKAFNEALRSCEVSKIEDLEIWDGEKYVNAFYQLQSK